MSETDKPLEEWKTIPEFPNYEASSLGGVRRIGSIWPLKQHLGSNGYFRVTLYRNARPSYASVHRVVLAAFIAKPEGSPECNHLDRNKQNNLLQNLEWCTSSQNKRHSLLARGVKTKIINRSKGGHRKGEAHYNHRLTALDVIEIHRLRKLGYTQDAIAKRFGICQVHVSSILNGKKWKCLFQTQT